MSQSEDHLKAGQLGTADVTASTVANIGPGIDFYFGFGVIAVTAGVAAPLTILAATVAVALLARRQIGGITGDVLGAAEQVGETTVLLLLAARLAPP